jgi:hypothetical protein
MKFKEDNQKFTVLKYEDGYHICEAEDGTIHQIDLQVCDAFPDVEDQWFVGKTFLGRVVPYKSYATELKEVEVFI